MTENEHELMEDINKYDTHSLIEFLKKNIQVKEEYLDILYEQEVTGRTFLKTTEETFRSYGLKGGPAKILAEFAQECAEKKERSFSSYKTLSDLSSVLSRFKIYSNSLAGIPQFTPSSVSLNDEEEELQQCMKEIKRKLRNMGTLLPDSNEAMRSEYISSILHAAINIVRRLTDKEISLFPQLEVVGDENSGRVDYAIMSLEELICITESKQYAVNKGFVQNVIQCESALQINKKKRNAGVAFGDCEYLYGIITTATEWYFLSYSPEKISCTFENPITIKFSDKVISNKKEDLELRENVKQVLEIIVGLLKDRLEDEKSFFKKQKRSIE